MSGKRSNIQEIFELRCNSESENNNEIVKIFGEGHNLYGEFELNGEYDPSNMMLKLKKYYKRSNNIDDPPYTPGDNYSQHSEHRVNLRKRRSSFLRSDGDELHYQGNNSYKVESPSKKRGRGRPYNLYICVED